jgi:4-hydroxy-3-methylbut-2-enyl diphosphate reductase
MFNKSKKIILISPRGFCAGVTRAVKIVERALEKFGAPVYVKHQIVHNKRVVNALKKKGARFVESLNEVPAGAVVIFSAHGVTPEVKKEAGKKGLKIIDATCPLVNKVHMEARKFYNNGYTVFFIGHKGHPEVVGVMGEAPLILIEKIEEIENIEVKNPKKVACLTQTTLSLDDSAKIIKALKKEFPDLVFPPQSDICYATQNRQRAIKNLLDEVDMVIVIGSKSSSNSNRLAEIAGRKGYLISDISEIDEDVLEKADTIGITAGASTPDAMVEEVIEYLGNKYSGSIITEEKSANEDVVFALPAELEKLSDI